MNARSMSTAAVISIFASCLCIGLAQDADADASSPNPALARRLPIRHHEAWFYVNLEPGREDGLARQIRIFPASGPSGEPVAGYYFYEPIFALDEHSSRFEALAGDQQLPAIVQEVDREGDPHFYVFRVALSLLEAEADCREALLERRGDEDENIGPIRCEKWPVENLQLRVVDRVTKVEFGSVAMSTVGTGPIVAISLPVPADQAQEFEARLIDSRIHFVWAGTYDNVLSMTEGIRASITNRAHTILGSIANTVQLNDRPIIDQQQYANLMREITSDANWMVFGATTTLTEQLIPLAQEHMQSIFTPLALADLPLETQREVLDAFVVPTIRNELEKNTATQGTTVTVTDERTIYLEKEGGREADLISAAVGIVGTIYGGPAVGAASSTAAQAAVQPPTPADIQKYSTVQENQDIEVQESSVSRAVIDPNQIALYRVGEISDSAIRSITLTAYQAVGEDNSPQDMGSTPTSFTLDSIRAAPPTIDAAFRVPHGSAICSFAGGDTAPPGFTWAEAGEVWPDEVWVPEHLRGRPMPDMNSGLLAYGTSDPSQVGTVFDSGAITIVAPETTSVPTMNNTPSFGIAAQTWVVRQGITERDRFGREQQARYVGTCPLGHNNSQPCRRVIAIPAALPQFTAIGVGVPGARAPVVTIDEEGLRTFTGDVVDVAGNAYVMGLVEIQAPHYLFRDWPTSGISVPLVREETSPPHARCRWMIRTD